MMDLQTPPGNVKPPAVLAKASSSYKWSALAEVLSKASSPLILVILARLLTPEQFGMVAVATLAITFIQMLWEGGLGRALIHLNQDHLEGANVVFWSNLILATGAFTALQLLAPQIAIFLGTPTAAPVLRVLGFQIILGALGSVQQALLTRDLNFRRLFRVRLASTLVPGMVSIPLALSSWGVWALVAGTLAGQTLSVIVLWLNSSWRPSLSFDKRLAQTLLNFGIWVVFESFGGWMLNFGDNLVVARNLGTHELGLYRTGTALVTVVFATILSPILPVAYPTFCRLQGDSAQLKETFTRLNRILVVAAIAISAGLFLVGPVIHRAFFKQEWHGLGWVISMLALMNGVAWTVGLNAELYRAMGRPEINTKLMYLQLFYYLPAYWFGSRYGLETFCIVRCGVAVLSVPLHVYFAQTILNLKWHYLWSLSRRPLIAAGAMSVVVGLLQRYGSSPFPAMDLVLQISLGALIFTGVLYSVDRNFFSDARSVFKRKGGL